MKKKEDWALSDFEYISEDSTDFSENLYDPNSFDDKKAEKKDLESAAANDSEKKTKRKRTRKTTPRPHKKRKSTSPFARVFKVKAVIP